MSLTKKNISQKMTMNTTISSEESSRLLNRFLSIVVQKSKEGQVKITNFGSFYRSKTPERVGRNPKTLESYIIYSKYRFGFKVSNYIKKIIN
jgi:nucleoid DNA-binding protein